jgi:uncharacterized protein (DUF433 family)
MYACMDVPRQVSESAKSRIFRRIRLSPVAPNDMITAMMNNRPMASRDPGVMGGAAVLRGARVPVQTLLDYLDPGESIDDFLEGFLSVPQQHGIAFLDEAKDRVA